MKFFSFSNTKWSIEEITKEIQGTRKTVEERSGHSPPKSLKKIVVNLEDPIKSSK